MLTSKQLRATDALLDSADWEFSQGNALNAVEMLRDAVMTTLADVAREKGWSRANDDDLYKVAERLNEKDISGLGFLLSGYSATQHFPDKVRYGFFDMSIGDAADARYIARSHVNLARKLAGCDSNVESGQSKVLASSQLRETENLMSSADMEFSNGNAMKAMNMLRDAASNTLSDIAGHKGWPRASDDDLYRVAERLNPDPPKGWMSRRAKGVRKRSIESGIMGLKTRTNPRAGALNRCYHLSVPTASESPSTIPGWWPMPGCSCRPLSLSAWD